MFTTICDVNASWQIKCGYDQCEEYKIGDKVRQWIDPNSPGSGYLLDGVYDGYPYAAYPAVWVVIKDGIVAIHDTVNRGWPLEVHEGAMLLKKFDILPPDPSLWSDEVWARKAKRQYLHECEVKTQEAELFGLSQELLARKHASALTRTTLRQTGILKSILPGAPEPPPRKFDYYWNDVPTRMYDKGVDWREVE